MTVEESMNLFANATPTNVSNYIYVEKGRPIKKIAAVPSFRPAPDRQL